MKITKVVLFSLAITVVGGVYAESDDQTLLDSFHEYGITKCDKFILENSSLVANWNYFISKHAGGIDGSATEVSLIRIWGEENDTVKVDDTYIQTPKNCYLHTKLIATYAGSCESNIDGKYWYVSTRMPGKDYTHYENNGGVDMHAKEIRVGNFKACIQETSIRKKGNQG
jgi:hypothetical protein